MIRLSFLSRGAIQQVVTFHHARVRFGSSKENEVCVESLEDPRVVAHQGDFVREPGGYLVLGRDTRHGIWVNGKRTRKAPIRGGERIRLGSAEGPEVRVLRVFEREAAQEQEEERT